jgi:hypothetical protein
MGKHVITLNSQDVTEIGYVINMRIGELERKINNSQILIERGINIGSWECAKGKIEAELDNLRKYEQLITGAHEMTLTHYCDPTTLETGKE